MTHIVQERLELLRVAVLAGDVEDVIQMSNSGGFVEGKMQHIQTISITTANDHRNKKSSSFTPLPVWSNPTINQSSIAGHLVIFDRRQKSGHFIPLGETPNGRQQGLGITIFYYLHNWSAWQTRLSKVKCNRNWIHLLRGDVVMAHTATDPNRLKTLKKRN